MIVGAAEHLLHFLSGDLRFEAFQLTADLRQLLLVVLLNRQLQKKGNVLQLAGEALEPFENIVETGSLLEDPALLLRVVPEAGLGDDRLDFFQAIGLSVDVKGALGGR
jgi:hypothetical protein